jgi:hypothetical protein
MKIKRLTPSLLDLQITGLAGLGAILLGVLIYHNPVVGIAAAISVLSLIVGVCSPERTTRVFLTATGVLLLGYASLGRAFSHIGHAPVFVGEIVLALGILAFAFNPVRWSVLRHPLVFLLLAFMSWGVVCTFPYLNTYRVDALRDAVVWGYGIFVILLLPFLTTPEMIGKVLDRFARFLPWFLIWIVVGLLLTRLVPNVPNVPGTSIPWFALKGGDMGVHLAGIGAFMLLGLHISDSGRFARWIVRHQWFLWLIWFLGFLIMAARNRGGMVSVVVALAVVFLASPVVAIRKLFSLIIVSAVIILAFVSFDLQIDLGKKRALSAQQIVTNAISITGHSTEGNLSGTREWRLRWWNEIINYTFNGKYFWTGKGYGINLADSDGFQVRSDGKLRSPHNGHLTILARSGVPGIILWTLLQITFALALFLAHLRARHLYQKGWANVFIFILAYWTAFQMNTVFDVFLEGPQGGIWFWSLFAFGLACLIVHDRSIREVEMVNAHASSN